MDGLPPLLYARWGHQAFLLGDGRVLVTGGGAPAEIYDPSSGGSDAGDLPGPAALLATGGAVSIGQDAAALWLDDGVVPLADPPSSRTGQTVTALEDGAILVAGGGTDPSLVLYDPISGPRTIAGPFARREHTSTRLGDGSGLLAGGAEAGGASRDAAVFLHSPLGPFSNLPTLTFESSTVPLVPRRPDHLRLAGGRVELTNDFALVAALDVGEFQLALTAGIAADGASATILFGWASPAEEWTLTLTPGQPVTLAHDGATVCIGETLDPAELPAGALAPLTLNWRSGQLELYDPGRSLLKCSPHPSIGRGAIGLGAESGTARFDDVSLTR
jgi:hypothetical protein